LPGVVSRAASFHSFASKKLNHATHAQLHIDFRTGRPTAIGGAHVSQLERAACSSLNRERARGIKEATRPAPSGESFSADGWNALVAGHAALWGVPLIPLESFGLQMDHDGDVEFSTLPLFGWGAECFVCLDRDQGCVFKFFEVHPNSGLGKKLWIQREGENQFRAVPQDGDLSSTIDKLMVLHDAGGCPTEIVGLADTGNFLIAKQPLCKPSADFKNDRVKATGLMKALLPKRSIGQGIHVFWVEGIPWCLGDLHDRNIMIDSAGLPSVIDALIGALAPELLRTIPMLQTSVDQAKALRMGLTPMDDDLKDCPDDQL
jgi:hypothetical protein